MDLTTVYCLTISTASVWKRQRSVIWASSRSPTFLNDHSRQFHFSKNESWGTGVASFPMPRATLVWFGFFLRSFGPWFNLGKIQLCRFAQGVSNMLTQRSSRLGPKRKKLNGLVLWLCSHRNVLNQTYRGYISQAYATPPARRTTHLDPSCLDKILLIFQRILPF